jgi:hypothetical protein
VTLSTPGLGETTGATYHGLGPTQETNRYSGVNSQSSFTEVNYFHVAGGGVSFLVREVSHVTVNANGTVTAEIGQFSITCN